MNHGRTLGIIEERSNRPSVVARAICFPVDAVTYFFISISSAIMDPATAVGLASAILSFVSFAGKLVKTAVKISQSGSLEENAAIERDINRTNEFRSRLVDPPGIALNGNEGTLQSLLQESDKASSELLKILQKIKAPTGSGIRTASKVVTASIKSLYYEPERKGSKPVFPALKQQQQWSWLSLRERLPRFLP